MYVKIVRKKDNKTELREVDSVSVYEDPTGCGQYIVDTVYRDEQRAFVVEPGGSAIYILNDRGQTIDSYRP